MKVRVICPIGDFVGELAEEKDGIIRLKNVAQLIPQQGGRIAIAKFSDSVEVIISPPYIIDREPSAEVLASVSGVYLARDVKLQEKS